MSAGYEHFIHSAVWPMDPTTDIGNEIVAAQVRAA